MKLANLAKRNYAEPGRIAYNAAMYIAVEEHDGREMLVCRPHAPLLHNEAYMDIFRQLGTLTASYTSQHHLRCITLGRDGRGEFWFMQPGKFVSLAQLMVDQPSNRLDEKWIDTIIAHLIDAAQYLHTFEQYALELTPHSVMVSKGDSTHVMLMPPLSAFIPIKNILYTTPDESLSPELFNAETPDQRADIYCIARIIQYLHPYDQLPYKYSRLVRKATSEKVSNRPTLTHQVSTTITSRGRSSRAMHVILSVTVVAALVALLFFFPWGGDNEHDIKQLAGPDTTLFDDSRLMGASGIDPLVNTDIESATEAEKERMLDNYLHDSTYLSLDTAYSLSPEMKEYQKHMMVLAAEKFRAKFKQQARPILQRVYTPDNLSSQDKFMQASATANQQLVMLQDALASQYQVDPSTAIRIAAEVQDEVINQINKQ